MSEKKTGLFAAVSRMDERLAKYGVPLNKQLLIQSNTFDKAHIGDIAGIRLK